MAERVSDELCTWAEANIPGLEWRERASDETLAEAERTVGRPLPAALRSLYGRHDGQLVTTPSSQCIFEGYRFLSVAEAIDAWRECLRVDEEVAREHPESAGSFRREWFPFAEDSGGSHWCVDLETGAVLEVFEDFEVGRALGGTFEEFLRGYLRSFERGERIIDGTWGPRHSLEPIAPAPKSPPISRRRKAVVVGAMVLYFALILLFVLWLERGR
jgi:cell wall assembly regulator SMI1